MCKNLFLLLRPVRAGQKGIEEGKAAGEMLLSFSTPSSGGGGARRALLNGNSGLQSRAKLGCLLGSLE